MKLVLDERGSYLGMEKGCFIIRDKNDNVERFPLFEQEIGEIILKSGNAVSTGALTSCGFWDIDVMVMTSRGRPVAMLRSLDDDSHVDTRICQYQALDNGKGIHIAKQFVKSRVEGQNIVLNKYNLKPHRPDFAEKIDNLEFRDLNTARKKLTSIEGKYSEHYFKEIFKLFPQKLRPDKRSHFKAYDGINNLFNLGYEMLRWKVHRALINAKLEPFLGFLHSVQYGKPSLVCDFQELYRYIIEDFLIQYSMDLSKKDFVSKTEDLTRKKKAKRQYLNDNETNNLMKEINELFETEVEIPRIKVGRKQTIETLINEEALPLARFLRNESEEWWPRLS